MRGTVTPFYFLIGVPVAFMLPCGSLYGCHFLCTDYAVVSRMFAISHDFKIAEAIVVRIFVNVMDDIFRDAFA